MSATTEFRWELVRRWRRYELWAGNARLGFVDPPGRPLFTEYDWRTTVQAAHGTCGSLSYAKRVVEVAAGVAEGDPKGDAGTLAVAERIAADVRRRAEQLAPSIGADPSLRFFCIAAALGLHDALKRAGVPARLAAGHCEHTGHVWVEVPLSTGHAILDVTATQFGDQWPPVVVAPPGSSVGRSYRTLLSGKRAASGIAPPALALLRAAPRRWWAETKREKGRATGLAAQVADGEGVGDR